MDFLDCVQLCSYTTALWHMWSDGTKSRKHANWNTYKIFWLQTNFIRGTMPARLLQQGSSLMQIMLGNNKLEGVIPDTIASGSPLDLISISHNNFTGDQAEYQWRIYKVLILLDLLLDSCGGSAVWDSKPIELTPRCETCMWNWYVALICDTQSLHGLHHQRPPPPSHGCHCLI